MNILVTGVSGFIGRNLVEYLSSKVNVLAPTHKDLELLDEDAVRKYFQAHPIDIIIHSATKPGHRNAKDLTDLVYSNIRIFLNIVRRLKDSQRMIFLSSGAVYDMRHYLPKMKEEYFDTHVPVDGAGFSKYIAAKYIEKTDNISELRIFGVFGRYEDYAIRFISNAICKTLFDLPITIKQNRRFDYIYINDLLGIIDYFIKNKGSYKSYNITPSESIELYEIAEKVCKISNKNLPIKVAQAGMGQDYSGDNSRLRQEIHGLRFTPIEEAITELYNWYLQNTELVKKEYLISDK